MKTEVIMTDFVVLTLPKKAQNLVANTIISGALHGASSSPMQVWCAPSLNGGLNYII